MRSLIPLILSGLGALMTMGSADPIVAARTEFRPGQPWPDSRGVHINAHGFCLLDFEGRHYWYGAHKIEGKPPRFSDGMARSTSSGRGHPDGNPTPPACLWRSNSPARMWSSCDTVLITLKHPS